MQEPAPEPQPEPEWEEPAWEEPIFDNITIASVVWPGNDDWDRAIYKLSNGYSAFASKGLSVGQTPFDYEELREQGGGYYNAPSGIVGHVFTRNGGALIVREGATFKQQQYGWGNQGPVFAAITQDVTSQIGKIEEMSNSDMDGDGEIGVVEADDLEVEVDSVVYDNKDGEFDRALYKMTDGSLFMAERGLEKGDLPMEGDQLTAKGGSAVPIDGLVGAYWAKNGVMLVYKLNGLVKQQAYRFGGQGLRQSGKLRAIKNSKQILMLEDRLYVDLSEDGSIGEADQAEIEIDSVLYDSKDGEFDRALYKMTDGSVFFAEQGLGKGDLPLEGDKLTNKDGSPVETKGLKGAYWVRDGIAIVYNNNGVIQQQGYNWGSRGLRASGKLRNVTKQVDGIEEKMGADINGDNSIGGQMDEDAEVSKVIYNYAGYDGFDRSIYEMDNGTFMLAEPGLVQGELPFEGDSLAGVDGKSFDASNAVGLMGMRKGFAMILKEGDQFLMQAFDGGGRGLKAQGKKRDITRRIYDQEERSETDFTNDGIIGLPHSGKGDPEISRVIFPGNDEYEQGLYQMQDGTLLFAEPDLEPGDSPFEDEVIRGKNGKPYQNPNVVGVYPIKNGFALVSDLSQNGYVEQGFKFGPKGPRQFGKQRKIKDIDKTEKRVQFDINSDQKIAGMQSENSSDTFSNEMSSRLINPVDIAALNDLLA